MISIMGCPLEELDTSALSASPRRLTEGVLEGEGPTSADAGVASCLLLDTETEFRRLRDDSFDGKILVGMIRLGGNELQKGVCVSDCLRVSVCTAEMHWEYDYHITYHIITSNIIVSYHISYYDIKYQLLHLLRWAPQLPAFPHLAFVATLKLLKYPVP